MKELKMKDMYIKPESATLSQKKELKLNYHLLDKDLFVGKLPKFSSLSQRVVHY